MNKRIIETYPHPIDKIIDKVIDYIVVYFNKKGEILDFNQIFNEVLKISNHDILKQNIKDLILFNCVDFTDLDFSKDDSAKRLTVKLNKKFSINLINNAYDSYLYKTNDIFCLLGKKELHDSDDLMNNMALLTNQFSNMSRSLSKKNEGLSKANEKIEELVYHDELTGLSNRRYFIKAIEKEIQKSFSLKKPLTLMICDLDWFKDINDTYGHDVGNLVLKAVGKTLNTETRKGELAARIGGEEFAIILTETSLDEGRSIAERLRKAIGKINLQGKINPVTMSFGITQLKNNDTFDRFFKRADMALYKAKNTGRNKVSIID